MKDMPLLFPRCGSSWDLMRRPVEIIVACALLLLTLPLMAGVALIIKCESPGPVFEREQRLRRGGRFTLLSFRTQPYDPKALTPKWRRERTPVARFLHYTGIDLLPRLFNVLRGGISLIEDGASQGLFSD